MDKPFRVVTVESTIVDGFDGEAAAQRRADEANKDAEKLGIKTRYKVVSK